jgi:agmatine deiminase
MRPTGDDDPNAEILAAIENTLAQATDAQGRKLDVITLPSPGRVEMDGEAAAASHMNFYIANQSVILPVYGVLTGDPAPGLEALETLKTLIDRPHFCAVDSSHILTGGGSFHCISQQQPAP